MRAPFIPVIQVHERRLWKLLIAQIPAKQGLARPEVTICFFALKLPESSHQSFINPTPPKWGQLIGEIQITQQLPHLGGTALLLGQFRPLGMLLSLGIRGLLQQWRNVLECTAGVQKQQVGFIGKPLALQFLENPFPLLTTRMRSFDGWPAPTPPATRRVVSILDELFLDIGSDVSRKAQIRMNKRG